MVAALLELLSANHIVDRDDDSLIPRAGVTVRELTEELLGAWDPEIGLVVSQLCGPDGKVQIALNGDGKMLCGQWADRVLTAPSGQPVNQRVYLRFVTTGAALQTTFRCLVETPYDKELKNMQRLNARIALAIQRMPCCASSGIIGWHTLPSAGHMPRGGLPKCAAWCVTALCTWYAASSK